MRSLIAYEGVFGLWRGLGPTLCRDVPFSGVYWAVYERIKQHYNVSVPTFWFSFCSGAAAGSVSFINTRTLFLIKTELYPNYYRSSQVFPINYISLFFQQIAAFVTTPFDVVKTHKQIEFGEKVLYAVNPEKSLHQTSSTALFKRIYKNNGIKGIFAGVAPRITKIAPACAIMITSFEYGKAFFFKRNVVSYQERNSD